MPSKLKKAIGAVKDRTSIRLAKVSSNASSNIEVAVLKATTHDIVPINDRHMAEVLHLVSSDKVHAAACACAIGKRIGRTRNWVVAIKSLMLVLRIFQDGDPYFPREVLHVMKRGSRILNLSSFRDDSNSSPWDFTSFVRTFALYLDERLDCFLTGKLQRRDTHNGSSLAYKPAGSHRGHGPNEPVRDMKSAMLLDKVSCLQRLLDRAIATRPTGAAKTNNLVHVALHAIVQESIDIYRDISDELAVVLDCFFHLQYQNCVTAFHTCIKAVKQFDELSGFYSLCKDMGIGRNSEYPSVETISEEVVESLREFLKDQSTFSSKGANTSNRQLMICAAPAPDAEPRHQEEDSHGGALSEVSLAMDRLSDKVREECTSLEELIRATETWKGPSISIDLETYPASQQEDEFGVADTGSSRSLPASTSMADLMSLGWTEEEHEIKEPDQNEKTETGVSNSLAPENWELMLVETISPSSPPANLSEPLSDNIANTFNAFPEELLLASSDHHQPDEQGQCEKGELDSATSKNWELVLAETIWSSPPPPSSSEPPSGNNPNIFNGFLEQPPAAQENPSTTVNASTNELQLSLFEAAPPQQDSATDVQLALFEAAPPQQDSATDMQLALFEAGPTQQDSEASSSQQSPLSAPTFQAIPTFSAENTGQTPSPMQNENDPFGSCAEFSGEQTLTDQQNLLQQQELWLQNQNKIIAKHWS